MRVYVMVRDVHPVDPVDPVDHVVASMGISSDARCCGLMTTFLGMLRQELECDLQSPCQLLP